MSSPRLRTARSNFESCEIEREQELFQRLGEGFRGDAVGMRLAEFRVDRSRPRLSLAMTPSMRLAHFGGVGDGHEHLLADGFGATVPEHAVMRPGEVEQGHGVAFSRLAVRAGTDAPRVGKRGVRLMAGSARLGAVDREDGIEKQTPAQRHAFFG